MVSASLQQVLDRLGDLREAQVGLPITSHRKRVGRAIVVGKKALRLTLQPMINELLRKQTLFNEDALLVLRSLVLDMKSLQDAALASQREVEERLGRLEVHVERLVAREKAGGASSSRVPRG